METYVCGVLRALAFGADSLLYPPPVLNALLDVVENTRNNVKSNDDENNAVNVRATAAGMMNGGGQALMPQNAAFYQQLLWQLSVRTVNPLPTLRDERLFLDGVRTLFAHGWKLGCEQDSQQATPVNNHMVAVLQYYFRKMQRHELAVEFWSASSTDLLKRQPELGACVATHLMALGRHGAAVKLLHGCQMRVPLRSALLLKAQAEYLWRVRGELDFATELYKFAVEVAPSDAESWLALSEL